MNQFLVVFQKEILQQWRNKQLIWVPLVMILLAIMDPLSFYFLPEILNMTGGLPEGVVFEIPELAPTEAIIMGMEQLHLFGILIIILISMGTLAGERKSLVAEIIFVKPLKPFYYVLAKWAALVVLSLMALSFGLIFNWYYVNFLFGDVTFLTFLKLLSFYSLWFVFVISVAIFFNSFLKSPGGVVVSTIITLIIMTVINMIIGHHLPYFPNQLKSEIYNMLESGVASNDLVYISLILVGIICILLMLATTFFRRIKL